MVARENVEHNSLFRKKPHSVWLSTHKGEDQVRILTTSANFLSLAQLDRASAF